MPRFLNIKLLFVWGLLGAIACSDSGSLTSITPGGSKSSNDSAQDDSTNQNDKPKPSDQSEGLPGYLTDPDLLVVDGQDEFLQIAAGAGTIQQKNGKPEDVVVRIGAVTMDELLSHVEKNIADIVVNATQVEKSFAVAADGSAAWKYQVPKDKIVVLSLLPSNTLEAFKIKNPPEGISVMYRDPAESNNFISLEEFYKKKGSSNSPQDPEVQLTPCGGQRVGEACWYLAPRNVDCSSYCAAKGGYDDATRTFAGSDGSDANCNQVLTALAVGEEDVKPWNDCGGGCGIGTVNNYRRRDTNPTTPECKVDLGRRACACNE